MRKVYSKRHFNRIVKRQTTEILSKINSNNHDIQSILSVDTRSFENNNLSSSIV